ncbi:MAG: phosphate signaling complex protein PhoU [Succinivibrio sp.]
MRFQLDELIDQINNSLILMSSACEESLSNAFEAFKTKDKEKALNIYRQDYDLNTKAREIEGLCIKTMLRQQPVAHDMLIVSATLKLVSDVERIGTQAIAIAEIITHFDFNYEGDDILLVGKMSEEAIEMVRQSIDSFVNRDGVMAAKVLKRDSVVDKYFYTIKDTLIHEIKNSDNDASYSLDLLMIAKYLERIGDHACNVARCTQYMLTGKLTGEE